MKGKMLLLIGLLCSLNARADDLATQIDSFIKGKFTGEPVQVKVRVRTPPAQWPACELPQLSLPPNARIGGNVSISARCGRAAFYPDAGAGVRPLSGFGARHQRRQPIDRSGSDAEGRPARYPAAARADRGEQSVRRRQPAQHQPRPTADPRHAAPRWIIKAGQPVQVTAQGEGFNISGAGKAMNNAAAEDSVRVRMASGQIVSGVVGDDGAIRITL